MVTAEDIEACLLTHPHDLIHKATGWILREVGKRNRDLMLDYLEKTTAGCPAPPCAMPSKSSPIRSGSIG